MKISTALAAASALFLVASTASAVSLIGPGPVSSGSDPVDGSLHAGKDILGGAYQYQGGLHVFRIELRSAPGPLVGNGFAGIYGVGIDSIAGGFDGSTSIYTPNTTGLDFLLDAHYEDFGAGPVTGKQDYHLANPPSPTVTLASMGGIFNPDGSALEFAIPDGAIGAPGSGGFTWYAYTLDTGSENQQYDIATFTAAPVVPEPLTMISVFGGMVGAGIYTRKRLRRSN
jgi:hypothetical protein